MDIHFFRRVVLCGALLSSMVSFTRAESYFAKDLGTLGGNTSGANALNNLGQVVGFANITNNMYSHATLFSGTGSNNVDLDAQGPVAYAGTAQGINDSGQIVGVAATSRYNKATLFTPSGKVDLGSLCDSGPTGSYAYAINNSGTIVGFGGDCNATPLPCRFNSAGTGNNSALGLIGGGADAVAYGINASGQAVGYGDRLDGGRHVTLFTSSGAVDLGASTGLTGLAYGINDAGQIAGDAIIPGYSAFHAVLYNANGSNPIDLGTLGGMTSHAYAINNLGEVVGNSYPSNNDNTVFHAFVYKNGVMSDLNNLVLPGSGFTNIRLNTDGGTVPGKAINDSGQIAAMGQVGGHLHAVLLTPILRKIGTTISGKDVIVTFKAIAGKTYRLQQTFDLANPNWQSVPGVSDITATADGPAQFTFVGGFSAAKAYYRVQLL